ncbi:hypothetical protein QR685DRAFT_441292 [Neurospora intermedia]|uniref:Uncharacterized protein n=1 Tax=Neurospora intermedia TaxID=5142 RepID=A0ABR3DCB9_NEUIN
MHHRIYTPVQAIKLFPIIPQPSYPTYLPFPSTPITSYPLNHVIPSHNYNCLITVGFSHRRQHHLLYQSRYYLYYFLVAYLYSNWLYFYLRFLYFHR